MSALVVFGIVGFLLSEALGESPGPPDIRVTVTTIRPLAGGHLVEFEAENRGGSTGAQVGVEGTLSRGGTVVERATATFDYVPEAGVRRGGLYFVNDPRVHDVEVRAEGYIRP